MNDTIGDGETEPGAAGLPFSGATHAIKRFEDLREYRRGNPWSLVGYANDREILSCSVIQLQADFHSRRLARVPNGVTNDIFNRASQQGVRTVHQAGIRIGKNDRALCGRTLKAGVQNDIREKKGQLDWGSWERTSSAIETSEPEKLRQHLLDPFSFGFDSLEQAIRFRSAIALGKSCRQCQPRQGRAHLMGNSLQQLALGVKECFNLLGH